MSSTPRIMLMAAALFAGPVLAQGQVLGQGQVEGPQWVARTNLVQREDTLRLLREGYLEDALVKGTKVSTAVVLLGLDQDLATRTAEDLANAVASRDEAEADLAVELRRALREEERADRLERLAANAAAIVDLVADPDALPSALRPLAFEALALGGPDQEAALLLPVLAAAGVETPYEVFMRLGTLGRTVPTLGVEDSLIDLALREPDVAAPFRALERCGGERTIERLRLVERIARGEAAAPALRAFNLLAKLAAREPVAVATAIVAQLEAPAPKGGCDEPRRLLLHRLLVSAAGPVAAPYLMNWVEEALRDGLEPAAQPSELLTLAIQALGAIGTESTVQVLRDLDERFTERPLQLAALEAFGHVSLEDAHQLGLLHELVERLSQAEKFEVNPRVRMAIHEALGRITSAPVSPSSAAWRMFVEAASEARATKAAEEEAR